jgi:CRISPR-associated Csx2 family protein
MDQLILLLGTGPSLDDVKAGEYQEATYCLSENPDETVTTPFVAEALIQLRDEPLDRVHILGTADAMWDVLLQHCGGELDEPAIRQLIELDEERPDSFPKPLRDRIQDQVGSHLGVPIEPHLIPIGRSNHEYWDMLRRLADLDIAEGSISIDVTHSLRSHPIFLLLALVYFRAVQENLSLGAVYYGALVLTDEFNGRTPIFDLRPMVELLDWIDAAQAFDRYGDAGPIASLLEETGGGGLDDAAKRARFVSQVLQLNTLSKIETNTGKLIRRLEETKDPPLPLQLIRSRLLALPEQLQGQPKWKAMLIVARQHWDSYRAGLALLAAWEAVTERLAHAYGLSGDASRSTYKQMADLACDNDLRWYKQNALGPFPQHAGRLRTFRNGIAHAEQEGSWSFEPPEVYREFPDILEYLEQHLGDSAFDHMHETVSLYERS